MNEEAKKKAEEFAKMLTYRQVVAYRPDNGEVVIFRLGPMMTEESITSWGWKIVHRYVPKEILGSVKPHTVDIPSTDNQKSNIKRGRSFKKKP